MTVIVIIMLVGLAAAYFLDYCKTHPGCLRPLFNEAQLVSIDAYIEGHDAFKAAREGLVEEADDLPDKRVLNDSDHPGDGSIWVLSDDGEIVRIDQAE